VSVKFIISETPFLPNNVLSELVLCFQQLPESNFGGILVADRVQETAPNGWANNDEARQPYICGEC